MSRPPKVVGYVRVSTDQQDSENQRFEISRYLEHQGKRCDEFVDETVTGKKAVDDRKLGALRDRLREGDTLIVSEVSRISRRLEDVLTTLRQFIDKGVTVVAVKQNFVFADDINSKVIAFAFGLAAEIERDLISARTKQALARKKAEGVKLGRPPGPARPESRKLYGHDEEIIKYLDKRVPRAAIARLLGVNRGTLATYIESQGLYRTMLIRRMDQDLLKKHA